jgi:hypothetical protein
MIDELLKQGIAALKKGKFLEAEIFYQRIIIIPASRKHSAIYGGKTDRIMIGINFYGLI